MPMGCALAINLVMFALTIKEYCAVEEDARRHLNTGIKEKEKEMERYSSDAYWKVYNLKVDFFNHGLEGSIFDQNS